MSAPVRVVVVREKTYRHTRGFSVRGYLRGGDRGDQFWCNNDRTIVRVTLKGAPSRFRGDWLDPVENGWEKAANPGRKRRAKSA